MNLAHTLTMTLPGIENSAYRNQLRHITDNLRQNTILTCYKDGSGTEQCRGNGYIITTNNSTKGLYKNWHILPDYCTIYQQELTAINMARESLHDYSDKHIIVRTDRPSSVQSITSLNVRAGPLETATMPSKISVTPTLQSYDRLQLTLIYGETDQLMS